jgi:CRP-like cAMP-binding protein
MSEAMIKGHELFQSLSFEEVEKVSSFAGPKPFKKGELVSSKGDRGSHFFVVLEGKVNLIIPSADGESQLVVGRLGKGDIFGLSPLLGSDRHMTTAKCGADSTVLAVEIVPFQKLLDHNPLVGLHMMTVMARAYFSRYVDTLGRIQGIVNEIA